MPNINFYDGNIHLFRITYPYLGAGNIQLYIQNNQTSNFDLVHTIKYASLNNKTSSSNPSFGLIMYARTDTTGQPTIDTDSLECGSYSISLDGKPYHNESIYSVTNTKTISTLTTIMTINNSKFFYGKDNQNPIKIKYISNSVDGTKNVLLRIVKNRPITGASYTKAYQYLTPLEYDTTGTTSTGGIEIFYLPLDKVGKQFLNIDDYNIVLYPNDRISFLAESSANSEVTVSIGFCNL